MTEKRFIYVYFEDGTEMIEDYRKEYITDMEEATEMLNQLADENEQLKKELYDITIDYYTETYSDNSVRRDEHIKDFKEEFKAKYGDVE